MQEYIWIVLVSLYGIFKGLREALKKKAMETNSVAEVLFFYTLFAFLMVIPLSVIPLPFAEGVSVGSIFEVVPKFHIVIFFKSFIIFVAWLCALNSIKRLPLSLYSVTDMSRVLFSIFFGVVLLGESIGVFQIIGMILVIAGITLVNVRSTRTNTEKPTKLVLLLVLTSCILNSVSAMLDKWILRKDSGTRFLVGDAKIDSFQLQFWYMFYLVVLYGAYLVFLKVVKKEEIHFLKCVKCHWIWILSLLFITADRALFIANSNPNSTVVVMTLIKQSSVLVTITMGKILYKEKHIAYRIGCAVLIIIGIGVSLL